MAKKQDSTPLTAEEIHRYTTGSNDFAFEMATVRALAGKGYACQHAATYIDPITQRIREFDVRARRTFEPVNVRLAVECKAVSAATPVIASRTPRAPHESFHSLLRRPKGGTFDVAQVKDCRPSALYPVGEWVARKLDQPKRGENGSFTSSDSATFEKWSQALNRIPDEVSRALSEHLPLTSLYGVLPVLVVPSGSLWAADYGTDGTLSAPPQPVSHVSLFVGHPWRVPAGLIELEFVVSHIEIMTIDELPRWSESLLDGDTLFRGSSRWL